MSTSDFSDSDSEEGSALDENFTQATAHVQRTHAAHLPNDLLQLYALYKQATVGRCNCSKPSVFNMQNRAKWSAWHELGDMAQTEAKQRYVKKVQELDPDWHAQLQQGHKFKSPHNWVVHSVHAAPTDLEQHKPEHEKDAFDYVKEGKLDRLRECLTQQNKHGQQQLQLQTLDEHGMGLIHWAADRNALSILELLIAAGVDVNMRDGDQQTALHYAASCGHIDGVRLLLNANADPTAADAEGQTCRDVAENADIQTLLNTC